MLPYLINIAVVRFTSDKLKNYLNGVLASDIKWLRIIFSYLVHLFIYHMYQKTQIFHNFLKEIDSKKLQFVIYLISHENKLNPLRPYGN